MRERGASPGRRVEHDLPAVEIQPSEPGTSGPGLERIEGLSVDAGVAGQQHPSLKNAMEFVGTLVHLAGHKRVGGEQVVGADEVAHDIGGAERAVDHVVTHVFERGAVPGVEVDLADSLGELRREGRVADQISARSEGTVVGGRPRFHNAHPSIAAELPTGRTRILERPNVLQMRLVRGIAQLSKEGFWVAEQS